MLSNVLLKLHLPPPVALSFEAISESFSRRRTFANAPRTLDLDIIFFDNRIIETENLTIPHSEWFKRASVVIPLASIR